VNKDKLFSIVTDYESYPQFVEGCHATKVDRTTVAGVIRVEYRVSVMSKDVVYTLDHKENPEDGSVEWKLVHSNFFKVNNGSWKLESKGDQKTDVVYLLDIEFKIPVPGFILKTLVKSGLPSMVKCFEKRTKSASRKTVSKEGGKHG
jgi:ribosome-associated toxin RatA of RatAB toxin-antitoxin module